MYVVCMYGVFSQRKLFFSFVFLSTFGITVSPSALFFFLSLSLIDTAAADQHVCAVGERTEPPRARNLSLAHIHAMGICSEFYF